MLTQEDPAIEENGQSEYYEGSLYSQRPKLLIGTTEDDDDQLMQNLIEAEVVRGQDSRSFRYRQIRNTILSRLSQYEESRKNTTNGDRATSTFGSVPKGTI